MMLAIIPVLAHVVHRARPHVLVTVRAGVVIHVVQNALEDATQDVIIYVIRAVVVGLICLVAIHAPVTVL